MEGLRRLGLEGTQFQSQQPDTIRLKLLKIGQQTPKEFFNCVHLK